MTDGARHKCRAALCVCVWVTVGSWSERAIDSCHLFHELAELPVAWVAVTHVLGGCDHGTDTLPICVLCRAVDLPAFLWAGVKSLQRHRGKKKVVSFLLALQSAQRSDKMFYSQATAT